MEVFFLIEIISLGLLIALTALITGSEAAFFALTRHHIESLISLETPRARRVLKLLRRPRYLMMTFLFGTTLSALGAATVASFLAHRVAQAYHTSLVWTSAGGLMITVILLMVAGQVLPRIIAAKDPVSISQQLGFPILLIFHLLLPFTEVLARIARVVGRRFEVGENSMLASADDLDALIMLGEEREAREEEERELLDSIIKFGERQVREVMVPRTDMVCIEDGTSLQEVMDAIKKHGHTRIPVYTERIDNVLGIIHVKDLLAYLGEQRPDEFSLTRIKRDVMFVPEGKMIDELLREFQRSRSHMAIVVDEYGGTAGLITLEDVIEEIVGEIEDEYDTASPPMVQTLDERSVIANARVDLHELNKVLEIELPTEEGYESLGGFILASMGRVPAQNESFVFFPYTFTVTRVDGNRILEVLITRGDSENEAPES